MRARPVATSVALLALVLASLVLVAPSGAEARPGGKRPKPTVAIALGSAEYDAGAQPVLTYSWTGLRKRDRLKLEYRTETGSWRFAQTLPKVTSRVGSATVAVKPVELGQVSYRFTVKYRKYKAKGARATKTVSAETGVAKVFGPVPIEDVIRTYPASNADVRRGTVAIGGQSFPFTFAKFFTGENTWRTLVSVPSTSCKGWGIPLATRHRSGSGGTFGMQVLGAGGALLFSNSAPAGTGTGLLFPSTVGSTITVQLRSDADVDYFGSGQAICYTDDGTL